MEIFLREFFPSLIMIYLFILLYKNERIPVYERRTFYTLISIWVLEGIAYELELITAELPEPTVWRTLFSVIGYSMRPLLISFSSLLLVKDEKTPRYILIYNIPCIINCLVMGTAFFSPAAFSYTARNTFHRGPLGRFPAYVMVWYFVILIYMNWRYASLRRRREKIGLALITVSMVVGTFLEMYGYTSGRFRELMMLCILIYFILLQNQILNNVADYDILTGLLTRSATMKEVEHYLSNDVKKRSDALLMIDVDNFKQVNDKLGHRYGDDALKQFACVLKKMFPANAICGRIGGDEFFVFLKQVSMPALEAQVQDFLKNAELTHSDGITTVTTTASVGIVTYSCDSGSRGALNKLYEKADYALYKAKAEGKNTYIFANDSR